MSDAWVCECGAEMPADALEATASVGDAVFRREPCAGCRRPMQLRSSFRSDSPGGRKKKRPPDGGEPVPA